MKEINAIAYHGRAVGVSIESEGRSNQWHSHRLHDEISVVQQQGNTRSKTKEDHVRHEAVK